MKNIEALIADGGDITIGAIYPIECAATAADGSNAIAMLVRRDGETLSALLKRLDKAIGKFYVDDEIIDEINGVDDAVRSLLVVGDEKQSIYSFQGAAPELFQRKKSEFAALLAGSEAPLVEEALTTSYRSAAAVLQLVDAVAAQPHITRATPHRTEFSAPCTSPSTLCAAAPCPCAASPTT